MTDERLQPLHLRKYLLENQEKIYATVPYLKQRTIAEPTFYFASTKNVFGHWLLEMFRAIIVYEQQFLSNSNVRFALWDETLPSYCNFVMRTLGIGEDRIDLLPFGSDLILFKKMHSVEMFHDDYYLFNKHFRRIIK